MAALGLACAGTSKDGTGKSGEASPVAAGPNIVLITLDTFRPTHLASYGYELTTGPFLDRLVAESTVFTEAHSTSSWTAPSTSSLFTGLYPTRHGVTEGFLANQQRSEALEDMVGTKLRLNRMPEEIPTLPEVLQQAGYQTFGVASNINIGKEIGFDRGFERFRKMQDRDAEELARQVKTWTGEASPQAPTFLYLHFNDVHEPYEPRPEWYVDPSGEEDSRIARLVAAYNSEISYLDQVLEDLYTSLDWQENTLLILVSDHGEAFGEHGQVGHQFSLHHVLMHALMVFHGPDLGIPRAKRRIHVSLIDVLPTLKDWLGVPITEGTDGRSLRPWLGEELPSMKEQREFRRRTLFGHRQRFRVRQGRELETLWAVVRGPWKLIDDGKRQRLFHLEKDPGETRNRARFQEDLVLDMVQQLDDFRAQGIRTSDTQTEVELDLETLETLRSLGYIQ